MVNLGDSGDSKNQPYFGIFSLANYPWQLGNETNISEIEFL